MGIIWADITLVNTGDEIDLRKGRITADGVRSSLVSALVDSGAFMLCINEKIQAQLGLDAVSKESAQMADGTVRVYPIVEPVTIKFGNRRTVCRAIVLPGEAEVLLGAIPLEDMDVILDMKNRKLIINPEHPYIPQHVLKGVR